MTRNDNRPILYKGSFLYDAVNVFVEDLAAALRGLGVETRIVDLCDEAAIRARHAEELMSNPRFILGFNGLRSGFTKDGRPAHEFMTGTYIAALVDHPVYHLARIGSGNSLTTVLDGSHLDFLRIVSPELVASTSILRHGASLSEVPSGTAPARDIDMLFAGTFLDPSEQFDVLRVMTEPFSGILLAALDSLLSSEFTPPHQAVMAAAEAANHGPTDDPEVFMRVMKMVSLVEGLTRAVKRIGVLRALDEAGVVVDIFGNNWPHGLFRSHRVHPPLPYRQVLGLMRRTKIMLNCLMVPGPHERPLSAMLNGAALLSDENAFFMEHFPTDSAAAYYHSSSPAELPNLARRLLENRQAREEMALRGQAIAAAHHTWHERAADLLKLVIP